MKKKKAVVNDSFDFIFRKRKSMRKITKMYKIQLYLQYLCASHRCQCIIQDTIYLDNNQYFANYFVMYLFYVISNINLYNDLRYWTIHL